MIYIFDKQLWKEGNEAVIKTEIGEVALRLENKSILMKKKIIVFDRYHVAIGCIEKKLFKKGLHYEISYDNQIIATMSVRRFFFFRRYTIRTPDNMTFKIAGSIKDFKYRITKSKKVVANVSPDLAHRPHQYGMETEDDKRYRYVFLCAAVVLSI